MWDVLYNDQPEIFEYQRNLTAHIFDMLMIIIICLKKQMCYICTSLSLYSPVQLDDFEAFFKEMSKDSAYKFSLQFEVQFFWGKEIGFMYWCVLNML